MLRYFSGAVFAWREKVLYFLQDALFCFIMHDFKRDDISVDRNRFDIVQFPLHHDLILWPLAPGITIGCQREDLQHKLIVPYPSPDLVLNHALAHLMDHQGTFRLDGEDADEQDSYMSL